MNITADQLRLYAVTDSATTGKQNLPHQVEEAIQGGATCIQLREKDLSYDDFVRLALAVKKITDAYNIPLIINDSMDVTLAVDADGVHLGQEDITLQLARLILGPQKIIGVSTHTLEEALQAQASGADYLGVGAVFKTHTKNNATPVSPTTLKNICASVTLPVVAIGGIHHANVQELKDTGIAGVAVVSALFGQPNIREAASALCLLFKQMKSHACPSESTHV